jgi:hypothetical protein
MSRCECAHADNLAKGYDAFDIYEKSPYWELAGQPLTQKNKQIILMKQKD